MKKSKSIHSGVDDLYSSMVESEVSNVFNRYQLQQPQCGFGKLGICCQLCSHGPCRITRKTDRGICGATADTIAARNLVRLATHGTGAYSHHLRESIKALRSAVKVEATGVKDKNKLTAVADSLNISYTDTRDGALKIADLFQNELARPSDELSLAVTFWAPQSRQKIWKHLDIFPGGPHSELADALAKSMTSIDTDPVDLLLTSMRLGIATGYVEMMGTEAIQDILYGSPRIGKAQVGLGVLDPEYVNLVAHGHEPFMGEAVLKAASSEKLIKLAKEAGAKGIKLYGSMDTGQELLQRNADHPAFGGQIGNWISQEFMVYTGAVDLVMMDMNCSIPGLKMVADLNHTQLVPVSKLVRMAGVTETMDYDADASHHQARQLVKMAIRSFKNRKNGGFIPTDKDESVVGFGIESILDALGGSLDPLLEVLKAGKVKGIAAVVGCTNLANGHDFTSLALIKELIKGDILVINSGCVSSGAQNEGLMRPEAANLAGEGLKKVCEKLGIPPVLNFGTCTDIGRIIQTVNAIGGELDVDPSQLPVAASAPEYLEQKAVVDGFFGVASGLLVHIAPPPPVGGASKVTKILTQDVEDLTGGKLLVETDPAKAADKIKGHIDKKREGLGL